jgi:predicted dehydrogenase
MNEKTIRIGLIGAGENTRARHIPGFRDIPGVELAAVCNRRAESTAEVARAYQIGRAYTHWEQVVGDPEIDAIMIGTWPYLHCPITLAALESGKHVLTEARMCMNAVEARQMLRAAQKHPQLVAQIVPSPFGLKGNRYIQKLLREGFLGELREVHVFSRSGKLADPASPLSWRQDAALSGFNMLTLGIIHETLLRWVEAPVQVLAQNHAFIASRIDPQSGVRRAVGTPDSVQVLTVLKNNARVSYHFSGVTPFGQGQSIQMFGTKGALIYDLDRDRIWGASEEKNPVGVRMDELPELEIPSDLTSEWQVEADFVRSIREGTPVELTDFATGVSYMEFTEAVVLSAEQGEVVSLPLEGAGGEE